MADSTSSIPPSSAASGVSGSLTSSVSAHGAPAQAQMSGLDVEQSPPQLLSQQQQGPVVVQGRVVSFDAQNLLLTIQTPAGAISVKSPTPIPPGTDVTVEIYKSGGKTLATLHVPRAALQQAQTPPPDAMPIKDVVAAPPAQRPPLMAGQTVSAILLPAAPPATTEQLALAIETLRRADPARLQRLVPPELLEKILMAPDIKALLQRLPDAQVKTLAQAFAPPPAGREQEPTTPDAVQKLVSAYQASPPTATRPVTTAAPPSAEDDLLQIIQAQFQAKDAWQARPLQPQTLPLVPPEQATPTAKQTLPDSAALAQLWEKELPAFAALAGRDARNSVLPADAPRNMYKLQIIAILPPGTPPQQVQAALRDANALPRLIAPPEAANVQMDTTEGQPILKTPYQSFVVTAPVRVPAGSVVIFAAAAMTPEDALAALATGGIAAAGAPDGVEDTGAWPALHDALRILRQYDPIVADTFSRSLPTPTPRLTPTALFFLAALRSGAVESWLGDTTIRALTDAGRRDIVDKLGADLNRLGAQSREPLPDAWRAITVPLLHDEKLGRLQFYVRQQPDRDAQGAEIDGARPVTRFIVNLRLSRMGEMQLDGLLRKRNFDMILRTEDKLAFEMRQELMQAFTRGLEQTGMQGSLGFQTRAQSWITVEQPAHKGKTV